MNTYNKDSFIDKKQELCISNNKIDPELYIKYGVKRGLRDLDGKGVLTGLTNISKIKAFDVIDGVETPCDGELWYRGYPIESLLGNADTDAFCFERSAYLLLFGEKPCEADFRDFISLLAEYRKLPTNFTRDVIMKAPSRDIMNSMTRSILTLASYDDQFGDDSLANNLRQCIHLISVFPMLAVYAYHAYNHYDNDDSMYIHRPNPTLSTAENLLHMLRPDNVYTALDAKVLATALVLHMEHGGGNNSTFTTRVVTSAGSDIYSSIAAAMSSLKGPKHGGANIKVVEMMRNIRENVSDTQNPDEIRAYLTAILDGKAFDGKGLIYGMGHAVYSISDPRERILRNYAAVLAEEKGKGTDFALYQAVEVLAPQVIAEKRHIYKGVSPNLDFLSGFIYDMLGIPVEMFTPIFAVARIAGWCAHRIEEIVSMNKIIRPSYYSVMQERDDA